MFTIDTFAYRITAAVHLYMRLYITHLWDMPGERPGVNDTNIHIYYYAPSKNILFIVFLFSNIFFIFLFCQWQFEFLTTELLMKTQQYSTPTRRCMVIVTFDYCFTNMFDDFGIRDRMFSNKLFMKKHK